VGGLEYSAIDESGASVFEVLAEWSKYMKGESVSGLKLHLSMPLVNSATLVSTDAWLDAFNAIAEYEKCNSDGSYTDEIRVEVSSIYFAKAFSEHSFVGFETLPQLFADFSGVDIELMARNDRADEPFVDIALAPDIRVSFQNHRGAVRFKMNARQASDIVDMRIGTFPPLMTWETDIPTFLKFLHAVEMSCSGSGYVLCGWAYLTVKHSVASIEVKAMWESNGNLACTYQQGAGKYDKDKLDLLRNRSEFETSVTFA
jgi:hypothetical protein